jgi:hypothetical protein
MLKKCMPTETEQSTTFQELWSDLGRVAVHIRTAVAQQSALAARGDQDTTETRRTLGVLLQVSEIYTGLAGRVEGGLGCGIPTNPSDKLHMRPHLRKGGGTVQSSPATTPAQASNELIVTLLWQRL